MSDPTIPLVPSTPEPDWNTLVATLIRALIQIASGLGFSVGAFNDSMITMISAGVVAIGTVVWSIWQKYRAAQNSHATAVESAASGKAVKAVA